MGKVLVQLSMSLDGFIAGPNDNPENSLGDGGEYLFRWYSSGDTDFKWPSGTMMSKVPAISAEYLREMVPAIGALVTGRRTFDIAHGWGGRHPLDVPVVVLTHTFPQEWIGKGSVFTFVSDGVESAIARSKEIAGNKNVAVSAASIAQQCLMAGLLDEIHIDLAPVLLGGGIRLFDHLGTQPIELDCTRVIAASGITHLTFRVLK
jgi:dihydrofolate reductase